MKAWAHGPGPCELMAPTLDALFSLHGAQTLECVLSAEDTGPWRVWRADKIPTFFWLPLSIPRLPARFPRSTRAPRCV